MYVWRYKKNVFPWEEVDGFYYLEEREKHQWFQAWKDSNPELWLSLCDKWKFDENDRTPWLTYSEEANKVENYWTDTEGTWASHRLLTGDI